MSAVLPLTCAPQRVLEGFGGAVRAACRSLAPRDATELAALFARASAEGMRVTFRGAGRSYGDAALAGQGLVLDLTGQSRILAWDPSTGVVEVEPGVTIEQLWKLGLPDGYWPAVVPGTMAPTVAGCAAMNVHGKNNFKVGTVGDRILDFDLLTADGRLLRCDREANAELFHAAIGGFGALGAFTRLRLRLHKVESGLLRVEPLAARSLDHAFELFEERLPRADYLVGWIDALARGRSLGRGQIHQANYLPAAEDPEGPARTLRVERQGLPGSVFGVPRSLLWRFVRLGLNDPGMRLVNALKHRLAALSSGHSYLQSHVAFAFLLDYVPQWRRAYGPGGFIQYQPFVPKEAARETFRALLELCQREGLPPYLAVMKRHRPDPFLLTHAVDGHSLAMDFKVKDRARLWALCHRMSDRVLDAGGRFYFAKDALLRPADVERAWGRERIDAFLGLKRRLDPQGILQSDLARRLGLD